LGKADFNFCFHLFSEFRFAYISNFYKINLKKYLYLFNWGRAAKAKAKSSSQIFGRFVIVSIVVGVVTIDQDLLQYWD
jgi:hypothetical protein